MWKLPTVVLAAAALAAGAAAQTSGPAPRREAEASAAPAVRTARPAGRTAPQVRDLTGPQATTVNLTENECTTLGGVVHSGPEVGDVCLSGKVCRHVDERDKEHLVCIAKAK